MSIQRYNPGLHHGAATAFPYNNGPYVTYDDHEATVRLKMAEAERNGRQACRLELEWRCRSWGMTDAEMAKHETFDKLLAAYTMHVHRVTERIPTEQPQ